MQSLDSLNFLLQLTHNVFFCEIPILIIQAAIGCSKRNIVHAAGALGVLPTVVLFTTRGKRRNFSWYHQTHYLTLTVARLKFSTPLPLN